MEWNDGQGDSWRDRISQPVHEMRVTKRLRVPMRDGVHLSVDVFAPDNDGAYPALVAYAPYWNEGQYLPVPTSNPHPTAAMGNYAIEAGDSAYLAARGYAHVVANVRGTGESEGEYQLMGPLEAQDGYDLIEWLAEQPWCDGNVGMVGVSYFSWIQYLVAAQQPPHLRAIAPIEGATDFYRDVCYRGGLLSLGFLSYWNTELSDRESISRTERDLSPEDFQALTERIRDENLDIRHVYSAYQLLMAPRKNPVLHDAIMHPLDGPWYHERSGYQHFDRIDVPVLSGAALDFWDLHLAGGFRAWDRMSNPANKHMIYPRFHLRPFAENHDVLVRWYDHWMKGNDTGMLDESPVMLWVQGDDTWRNEHEWPLERTEWKRLYLRADNALSWDEPAPDEGSDSFDNIPYVYLESIFGGVPSAVYRTEPLESALEVSGPIALELMGSLTDTDGHWIVEIRDVSPDGSTRIVTKGWLKASFRALNAELSTPFRPERDYTDPEPVTPGAIDRYAIQVHDTSNTFLAGHRLELIVKSLDHSLEGEWNTIFYHLPSSRDVTHTVHHNAENPSYLLLPVVPRAL